jgi:putative oxidoreductase
MRAQQLGIAILRMVVGIIFVAHGAPKLFVVGFGGVTHIFRGVGIPLAHPAAIVVTIVEFAGGIVLILGVGTRYAALLLVIDMAVAVKVHLHNGLFAAKGGYEFPLTLLAPCIALASSRFVTRGCGNTSNASDARDPPPAHDSPRSRRLSGVDGGPYSGAPATARARWSSNSPLLD